MGKIMDKKLKMISKVLGAVVLMGVAGVGVSSYAGQVQAATAKKTTKSSYQADCQNWQEE